ncbi:flagellar hook-length control protein FliK [Marinomonas pollencensis]|uniref:Flagellar hook-length control protein FliK n=1 Tax=Marinomonas pollencensis TaxID=491954 RepID=A0A3E0DJS2_9GAMM|nr:flagellar hook-length control protein FliK [Marinomonas pollencensis]REG82959.1 flagellar hook-length control protein FliK [Marinomonas pollencensis]
MISDIKSSNQAVTTSKAPTTVPAQAGTISQLQSEIRLIKDLSLIKIQGSESLSFQGKPAQLISATSNQHAFTLINTGPSVPLDGQQTAKLSVSAQHQASLSFANNPPVTSHLGLASRIIPLTALTPSHGANGHYQTTVSDGQQQFQISSQSPLKKGETIRVLLDNQNQLQVIPNKLASPSTLPVEALKQSLPQQLSSSEMSQLIKRLEILNSAMPASLSPQSKRALAQLIQGLPALEKLTQSSDAMKHAIQNSGQFAESSLKNTIDPSADLKLNLTRLDNATKDNPAQRSLNFPTEQVASAIERVTSNQLRHFSDLSQNVAQNFPLHIELPIKDNQQTSLVQLQIDQDAADNSSQDHARRWLVKLNFDFEETGRFEARAGIQENKVGIIFAAEDAATTAAIKQQMGVLKQQLIDKDIEVQRLEAFQSKLQEDKPQSPTNTSLIDVRT